MDVMRQFFRVVLRFTLGGSLDSDERVCIMQCLTTHRYNMCVQALTGTELNTLLREIRYANGNEGISWWGLRIVRNLSTHQTTPEQ